jgi:hypothetical protein
MKQIVLGEIAHARSGDKGSNSNIGVIAYTPHGYQFLKKKLTSQVVKEYFSLMGVKEIQRYELENLGALNFILKGVLGVGGSRSLRIDAQGKVLGQAILEMPLQIPEELYEKCRRHNYMI